MRIMTVALALCIATSSKAEVRKPLKSPVRVFVVTSDPYWVDTSPNAKLVAQVDLWSTDYLVSANLL